MKGYMLLYGVGVDKEEEEAKKLLFQLGLGQKYKVYPNQLSGGEQQRVAIARALMMHPKVLLLDEPTASLDPENVQGLITLLKVLQAQGQTLLVSTHDISFARHIATQVLFLDQGTLVEQGGSSLFEQPKTTRFQDFLTSCQQKIT